MKQADNLLCVPTLFTAGPINRKYSTYLRHRDGHSPASLARISILEDMQVKFSPDRGYAGIPSSFIKRRSGVIEPIGSVAPVFVF